MSVSSFRRRAALSALQHVDLYGCYHGLLRWMIDALYSGCCHVGYPKDSKIVN